MYEASFFNAKNGSKTVKINNLFLHSSYNPETEAERFVSSIDINFNPSVIFIIEPGLSYCLEPLKKLFPKTNIFSIRFMKDFSFCDGKFSGSFFFDEKNPSLFEEELFNSFSGKILCSALFLEWPNSEKIFKDETKKLSSSIKHVIEKAKAILITEGYFSKRWFKNSIVFNLNLGSIKIINRTEKPVIICASGESLSSSINFLRQYRKSYFLIAASSAINVLLNNKIIPDLAFSTDGGFWAKNHLVYDYEKYSFPVALTPESAFPKKLSEKSSVLPLLYKDGFASRLTEKVLNAFSIPFFYAERNGTVSGTMALFALSLTEKKVFACGLDLEAGKGKQHAEPNRNENFNKRFQNRIKTLETRNASSRFNSKNLDLYRNWFITFGDSFSKRFERLSCNYKFIHNLGNIKDVDFSSFNSYIKELEKSDENFINEKESCFQSRIVNKDEKHKIRKIIKNEVESLKDSKEFLEELFPLETMILKKTKNTEEKEMIRKRIEREKESFIKSIFKLIDK